MIFSFIYFETFSAAAPTFSTNRHFQRNFRFHRKIDPPQACPASRLLPCPDGNREEDEEASSGSDGMDVDAGTDNNAPGGGGCGLGGDSDRDSSFSSQVGGG